MAQAQTNRFSEFLFLIGDAESPEEFELICGATSKGLSRNADTNSTNVPDCDDEDAPSWLEFDITSLSWSGTVSGVADLTAFGKLRSWFNAGLARNVQFGLMGETEQGTAILTSLEATVERGQKVQFTATLTGSGELSVVST